MGDHYVYAIYNRTTGEYYLGKRSCRGSWADDGKYMGSGQKLRRKRRKHPDHVWEKEVLLLLDSAQEALEYERVLVGDRYKTDKRCLNLCAGGEGNTGHVKSDETKAKQSAAMKGRTHSAEVKAKMSAAHKGKTISEEQRVKMSVAQKGKTISEETKAKISAAHKGKTISEEQRAKMSVAQKGKTLSEETKAKMSAVRKGKTLSDETKAKLSTLNVQQTVSLVRAGVVYGVQVEDVQAELRAGAEFNTRLVWVHNPQVAAATYQARATAKALLLLDAGWQCGCRRQLRKVKIGDIDLATGLLR